MRARTTLLTALAGTMVLGAASFAPAGGSAVTVSPPIASGLAGPLQFAVGSQGTLVVAQDDIATLTAIHGNTRKNLVSRGKNGEIAGVAITDGAIVFTAGKGNEESITASTLEWRSAATGKTKVLANLLAYEQQHNPDHKYTYGFENLAPSCAKQLPPQLGPPTYRGLVDSHAYSVAAAHSGYFVADAGGNDIVEVSTSGAVRTVTVLPPEPAVVTSAGARANHLPQCTVGHTYRFESVPTDVEMGNDGYLYASTLPGGPEDASLGARGGVWRINPNTGAATQIATGLLGGANVAVAPDGTVYATELFGNRVDRIENGHPVEIASLPAPSGLEYAHGKLYVSYDVMGSGKIATIAI
ncbi:MAG TPA: ScyD/ScyE family protein [Acidimicrobiia bacterium]|jgi:hypothetical protein